mmetsp:Transcript_117494/g.228406  ORF Transcript_117494/g.228406 Transcript_117494/m.228406 type:complete len:257 (+) Transcript_117494:29-799(+)
MLSPLAPPVKVKNTFIEFDTPSEDEACLSRNRASSCPPCLSFNPASSQSLLFSSDKQAANVKDQGDDSRDFSKTLHCKTSGEHDSDSEEGRCSSMCTRVTPLSSSAASSQEPSNRTNDTLPLMRTLHNQASELPTSFLKKIQVVVRVAKFCLQFVSGERNVMESKTGNGNWWTLIVHVPSGDALAREMVIAIVMEEVQHTAAVTKGVSVLSLEFLQLNMPTEHGFRAVLCSSGEIPQHPPETAVIDVKVAMLSNGI